jgi:hypothetical protein
MLACPAIDPKWLDSELVALSKLVDAGYAEGVSKRLAKIARSGCRALRRPKPRPPRARLTRSPNSLLAERSI